MYYNDSEQLVTVCDISTLSCSTTIDGLQPYTLYSIEVSSRNAAGEGPRTNPIIVRTDIRSEFIKLFTVCTYNDIILYVHITTIQQLKSVFDKVLWHIQYSSNVTSHSLALLLRVDGCTRSSKECSESYSNSNSTRHRIHRAPCVLLHATLYDSNIARVILVLYSIV